MRLAIVGGGPSGLATAIAAGQRHWDVTVFDPGHAPRDKACGEGLMPAGLNTLRTLGISLDTHTGHRFEGIRYIDASGKGQPIQADGRFPEGEGRGIRRNVLHGLLAERAETVGAHIRWGTAVDGLSDKALEVSGTREKFDWIIGADGLHSSIRKWADMGGRARGPARYGARRHFSVSPWSPWVEVHFAVDCEAYVTPVGPQEVGIAFLWSGGPARYAELLSRFPTLEERVRHAEPLSSVLGAGPLRQEVRTVMQGNVALVGDASGYLDAITGEGLAMSFRQATALIAALESGTPRDYIAAHRSIVKPYLYMTHIVLWATRYRGMRRRIIKALSREPALFSILLGAVEGQGSLAQLGMSGASRLGWHTLAG